MIKKTFQGFAGLLILILLLGCQANIKISKPITKAKLYSTLWAQSAAESKANALQVYKAASLNLAATLSDHQHTAAIEQVGDFSALPPAIILDVDETVLDNSQYEAQLLLADTTYDVESWDQWVSLQSAPAVAGAVDFINMASDMGVQIFYVTNRECLQRPTSAQRCPQKMDTVNNLIKVGIKQVNAAQVWLKDERAEWTSEKYSRRMAVLANFRVVMQFGDDLGDFLAGVKSDITIAQRAQLVDDHADLWGSSWFVFSNPVYGSWLSILDNDLMQYLEGY